MKKCKTCKSSLKYNLCSNMKCKVWKEYRQAGMNWYSAEHGLMPDDAIVIYCHLCNSIGLPAYSSKIICKCIPTLTSTYTHTPNKWYRVQQDGVGVIGYAIQYIGQPYNEWGKMVYDKT